MVFVDIADRVARGIETVQDSVSEALFEPAIRLGVTGLSQAGKTVFITSLVANLLQRGRMPQLIAAANGSIHAAYLRPQPDDTVPRFDYETHLAAMTGPNPRWPESTRAISELRISFRVQHSGLIGALSGPRTVHLDIVDYPGEWLLDLALLDKSYAQWSEEEITRIARRDFGDELGRTIASISAADPHDEDRARELARAFTDYLGRVREAGLADCTPGRFLLPGDLAGSPVLTFGPLPRPEMVPRNSIWREMERRYEAYKSQVVRPFFRDHFARIDRQVVLVDALSAIHAGPRATEDLRRTMAEVLAAFRPGRSDFLSRIFRGRRVDRILFAATKADHLHHRQHAQLTRFVQGLVHDAAARADFAGAGTAAMAIAAVRATVEETVTHDGAPLDCVRGTTVDGKTAAFFAGELPDDPRQMLAHAREGGADWLDADFGAMRFVPPAGGLRPGEGPPHIRLDRALQFLIGDRL